MKFWQKKMVIFNHLGFRKRSNILKVYTLKKIKQQNCKFFNTGFLHSIPLTLLSLQKTQERSAKPSVPLHQKMGSQLNISPSLEGTGYSRVRMSAWELWDPETTFSFVKTCEHDFEHVTESPGSSFSTWKLGMMKVVQDSARTNCRTM